jgi:alanine dehydrogenase
MCWDISTISSATVTNVTLPYVKRLAALGWRKALEADPGFAKGLNIEAGMVRHPAVAQALGLRVVAAAA